MINNKVVDFFSIELMFTFFCIIKIALVSFFFLHINICHPSKFAKKSNKKRSLHFFLHIHSPHAKHIYIYIYTEYVPQNEAESIILAAHLLVKMPIKEDELVRCTEESLTQSYLKIKLCIIIKKRRTAYWPMQF